jgi:L-gulonate 5-dehydrogenase
MEMRDISMPKIEAPDDVLVKVIITGICGSDMHNLLGEATGISYPLIAGHEMTAEVVEFGPDVKGLETGDHVIMNPVISCGYCYPCSIGRNNICENLKARGAHFDGCMREYMVLKRRTVHKISREIPWENAALVEPFTIAGQSSSRAGVTAGDTVYIVGAGPIGLCIMIMCKLLGARVIICDIIDSRLARAEKLGADYTINVKRQNAGEAIKSFGLHGVTVGFDAAANPDVIADLIKLMLPAGRIVSLSFHNDPVPVSLVDITKKELTILGSRLSVNQFDRIIKIFEEKKINGTPLVSAVFDFDHIIDAFNEVKNNKEKNCKVLIRINT